MSKFYQISADNFSRCVSITILVIAFLSTLSEVDARDRGDDVILTKGKLIIRGGKGKGNLILDTGSHKSSGGGHSMMSMMPMMHQHFNPFQYYPMHQQQHHQPQFMIQPIYIEDHSAMHQQHHHEEQPQHQYHHEEPQQQHYQHHEVEYQHQPMHHEMQMHHEMPMHHEAHHEGHHEEQHHEMPMHYEHEAGHHEEGGHQGGYETNPMMSMMMHGSGLQPAFQQLAAVPMYQPGQEALLYAQHQIPIASQAFQGQAQIGQALNSKDKQSTVQPTKQSSSTMDKSASTNPLVAIIKPLFKRHNKNTNNANGNDQQKKP